MTVLICPPDSPYEITNLIRLALMCGRSNRKFEFLFRPPKRRIIGSFIVFIAVITESMFVALESLMNFILFIFFTYSSLCCTPWKRFKGSYNTFCSETFKILAQVAAAKKFEILCFPGMEKLFSDKMFLFLSLNTQPFLSEKCLV